MAAGLAEELLSGPRGRRLCWSALDAQSFQRTGRCELHMIEDGGSGLILPALQRVIGTCGRECVRAMVRSLNSSATPLEVIEVPRSA